MKTNSCHADERLFRDADRLLWIGIRTVSLILLYYCFSIGITFYQKWFIAGFPFPLSVVLCHLIVKYALAALIRSCHRLCGGKSRPSAQWSASWDRAAITGVASSLDIGLSNWSFEFITISLYTMTKTTSVIFILIFAIALGLERKRLSVVSVVCLIASGLLMFTYKSTQFRWEGFALVIAASFLSGLRWTLAQLLMQRKDTGLSNPVDMIFVTQPFMIATLTPLVLVIEVVPVLRGQHLLVPEAGDGLSVLLCILIGSAMAFLMETSEYLLLSHTSSLTLSISSIVKEVITLILAYEYNNDPMTPVNCLGFLLCISGIGVHVWIKVRDMAASDDPSLPDSDGPEGQLLIAESTFDNSPNELRESDEFTQMMQHPC